MTDDRKEIADIINKELKKTKFGMNFEDLTQEDILIDDIGVKNLITFPPDKNHINRIFTGLTKDRYQDFGRFHHFKSANFALSIITDKSIQASSLSSNDENDYAEYTEFYKRVGFFHPLVAEDFQKKAFHNKINPGEDRPADAERKHIFVLCFTQDNHNEKFWKEYANNDHGVAIGFKFLNFVEDKKRFYNFRDMFYDEGYSFDFYNAIDYKLRRYNKMLFADGIDDFAKFYKRADYNWENETRLCFHYDVPGAPGSNAMLDTTFPIQNDPLSQRKYIDLPLVGNQQQNPFFNLTVTELVCGKYVDQSTVNELKKALKISYPDAEFWQRP